MWGFIVLWEGDEHFAIPTSSGVIGRDLECEVVLPWTRISRRQITFVIDPVSLRLTLTDLGATNGLHGLDDRGMSTERVSSLEVLPGGKFALSGMFHFRYTAREV